MKGSHSATFEDYILTFQNPDDRGMRNLCIGIIEEAFHSLKGNVDTRAEQAHRDIHRSPIIISICDEFGIDHDLVCKYADKFYYARANPEEEKGDDICEHRREIEDRIASEKEAERHDSRWAALYENGSIT